MKKRIEMTVLVGTLISFIGALFALNNGMLGGVGTIATALYVIISFIYFLMPWKVQAFSNCSDVYDTNTIKSLRMGHVVILILMSIPPLILVISTIALSDIPNVIATKAQNQISSIKIGALSEPKSITIGYNSSLINKDAAVRPEKPMIACLFQDKEFTLIGLEPSLSQMLKDFIESLASYVLGLFVLVPLGIVIGKILEGIVIIRSEPSNLENEGTDPD